VKMTIWIQGSARGIMSRAGKEEHLPMCIRWSHSVREPGNSERWGEDNQLGAGQR
jgi:hypothetical protein